jgi:hypothetical protein
MMAARLASLRMARLSALARRQPRDAGHVARPLRHFRRRAPPGCQPAPATDIAHQPHQCLRLLRFDDMARGTNREHRLGDAAAAEGAP